METAIHQDKHNIENKEGITAQIVCDDPKNPNKYDGCCFMVFLKLDIVLMSNKVIYY